MNLYPNQQAHSCSSTTVPPSGQFLNNSTHRELANQFGAGGCVASSFTELQILYSAFLYLGCLRNSNNCFTQLFEILFSLTPIDFFKKIPNESIVTYNIMGTYLLFYYILGENPFFITFGWTFQRLILFPKELYLKGMTTCLRIMKP